SIAESSVWYVIAAWAGPKEFCMVRFGLGEYDEEIFSFRESGPCNGGGWEVPSTGWPGAHEGILIIHADHWWGDYVPVYWFGGYGYYEGQIPLSIDENEGFGGFTSCQGMPSLYHATCFGALGVFTAGADCYHSGDLHACCVGETCSLISQDDCDHLGGAWYPHIYCNPNPCLLTAAEDDARLSDGMYISSSTPNPFEHSSNIYYEIPSGTDESAVSLRVYDPSGRLIRTLVTAKKISGRHAASWNGLNDAGELVPAGVYFYQLHWHGRCATTRVLLLR
ncbi:FlgD immunoglobulin-like domain containing protein, partial [Candidatus Eisenbacteria bacterium]